MSISWVGPTAIVSRLFSGIADFLESENRLRQARLSEDLVDFACQRNNLLAECLINFQQRRWQKVVELFEISLTAAETTIEHHFQIRREIARKISCTTNPAELEICLKVQKLVVAACEGQIRQIEKSCQDSLTKLLEQNQKEVQKFLEMQAQEI